MGSESLRAYGLDDEPDDTPPEVIKILKYYTQIEQTGFTQFLLSGGLLLQPAQFMFEFSCAAKGIQAARAQNKPPPAANPGPIH